MRSVPLYMGTLGSGLVVEKVLHEQQFSHKTSRVLGLEKAVIENACLTR